MSAAALLISLGVMWLIESAMLPTATGWTAGAHRGHRAPACLGQHRAQVVTAFSTFLKASLRARTAGLPGRRQAVRG
jgi:hypothetical protein